MFHRCYYLNNYAEWHYYYCSIQYDKYTDWEWWELMNLLHIIPLTNLSHTNCLWYKVLTYLEYDTIQLDQYLLTVSLVNSAKLTYTL